jgi:hypothetical protein
VPKRSNDFQVVVFLIKNHLAGQATVTESHELTAASTGAIRPPRRGLVARHR